MPGSAFRRPRRCRLTTSISGASRSSSSVRCPLWRSLKSLFAHSNTPERRASSGAAVVGARAVERAPFPTLAMRKSPPHKQSDLCAGLGVSRFADGISIYTMPPSTGNKFLEGRWYRGRVVSEVHKGLRCQHAVRTQVFADVVRPMEIVTFLGVPTVRFRVVNVVHSWAQSGVFEVLGKCERPLDTHQVDQTPGAVILWRHTSDPVSILCLRPYSGLAAGKGADGTGTKRGESTIKTDNVRIEAHGIREFA